MRTTSLRLWILAALAAAACVDGTGPGTQPRFSQQITFDEFDQTLSAGAARVEIELTPGALVADNVEIRALAQMSDEEEIESPITAIDAQAGTVTLALGGLTVRFDGATEFDADGDRELDRDAFVARVEAALAAGAEPAVEAERRPPASPQAPDDASFLAAELELDDEADEPEIEINIDADNLLPCDAAPPPGPPADCLGVLRVLDLPILLRRGVTEFEADRPDLRGEVDFEGVVQSANLTDGSLTLANGTVVRLVAGTEVEAGSGDEDQLGSLAAVTAAIEQGLIVEADGKGVVESEEPLTIIAIEVEFEIEDEAEDVAGEVDFEDRVTAVDPAAGTLVLSSGTVVRVVAGTVIDPSGDLHTLAAVGEALAVGRPVRARGDAVVESLGPPRVLAAVEIRLEVDD